VIAAPLSQTMVVFEHIDRNSSGIYSAADALHNRAALLYTQRFTGGSDLGLKSLLGRYVRRTLGHVAERDMAARRST
jgi:hypothetical protein